MTEIECVACHRNIEEARAIVAEKLNACLEHHDLKADVDIRITEDTRFADQSLSHLDRVMQWAIQKLRRT